MIGFISIYDFLWHYLIIQQRQVGGFQPVTNILGKFPVILNLHIDNHGQSFVLEVKCYYVFTSQTFIDSLLSMYFCVYILSLCPL